MVVAGDGACVNGRRPWYNFVMPAQFKPSLTSLCKLGTIAHNRPFTRQDVRDAATTGRDVRAADALIAWLVKHKLAEVVRGTPRNRAYFPTEKGWKMVTQACTRRAILRA